MKNVNDEVRLLVSQLEKSGKVELPGTGILELRNKRLIFSNPYNVSLGVVKLRSKDTFSFLTNYVQSKTKRQAKII